MSKSTPSTSTSTTTSAAADAQAPYLKTGYGAASDLLNSATGNSYLSQLQDYSNKAYSGSADASLAAVPAALNYTNSVLGGTWDQSKDPAGAQIGALNTNAASAANAGASWGNSIGDAARGAFGAVSPEVQGLQGLQGQYNQLANTGYQLGGQLQGLSSGALGTGQSELGALSGLAPSAMNVANPATQGLYGNATNAISGNPIYNSLMGMASGQYTNPASNPALQGTIKAATDPLVSQYQTATAPQLASSFEAGGRYGSGAATNAQGQAQQALARGLGGATSSIVNNAYNTGLQAQLGAGQALGSAYNTGLGTSNQALSSAGQLGQSGVTNAGNLLATGYGGAQSGYTSAGNLLGQAGTTTGNLVGSALSGTGTALNQAGLLQQGAQGQLQSGLTSAANAVNQGYSTAGTSYNSAGSLANQGTLDLGSIAQNQPTLANYAPSQLTAGFNSLWAPAQNYASIIGSPVTGTGTSSTTTPYYSNTGSQVASGLSGAASLAKIFAKGAAAA